MITLTDGDKDCLPYVEVTIEPGRWPFEYWYEVSYWNGEYWVHDYERDGGAFGLWRAWQKARQAMSDCWFEQFEQLKGKERV